MRDITVGRSNNRCSGFSRNMISRLRTDFIWRPLHAWERAFEFSKAAASRYGKRLPDSQEGSFYLDIDCLTFLLFCLLLNKNKRSTRLYRESRVTW
jgi:hypothetical protein